jgi:tRNA threonylcarbamoyladenosine biosynthesis protein TsaB
MIILAIRTDKPESEIGLYDDNQQLAYLVWEAHRALGVTIHQKIDELLKGKGKTLNDLKGIVVFQGPGSFTGLRIGLTVANTLAYALHVPIVGAQDPAWLETGITALLAGHDDKLVMPEYGGEVFTTQQKK